MVNISLIQSYLFKHLLGFQKNLKGFKSNIEETENKICRGQTSNFVTTHAIICRKQNANECQCGKQIHETGNCWRKCFCFACKLLENAIFIIFRVRKNKTRAAYAVKESA